VAEHERDHHGVVELAGHWDEVGHQVDRGDDVAEQDPEQDAARARHARVCQQTAGEHQRVRHERRPGARLLAPPEDHEDEHEPRVKGQRDPEPGQELH
jgi:hypothetical protein